MVALIVFIFTCVFCKREKRRIDREEQIQHEYEENLKMDELTGITVIYLYMVVHMLLLLRACFDASSACNMNGHCTAVLLDGGNYKGNIVALVSLRNAVLEGGTCVVALCSLSSRPRCLPGG